MKRFAVALVLALLPMVALAPAAGASFDEWCDSDPLVVITTPGKNTVAVFNTNGVKGLKHQPALLLADVDYTVQSIDGGKRTLVKMQVTLPNGLYGSGFETRAKISTGPMGTLGVLAAGNGVSGKPIKLEFVLDVA